MKKLQRPEVAGGVQVATKKICYHQSAKKEPGETGDKAAEQFTENIACIPPVEPRLYPVATGNL